MRGTSGPLCAQPSPRHLAKREACKSVCSLWKPASWPGTQGKHLNHEIAIWQNNETCKKKRSDGIDAKVPSLGLFNSCLLSSTHLQIYSWPSAETILASRLIGSWDMKFMVFSLLFGYDCAAALTFLGIPKNQLLLLCCFSCVQLCATP